MTADSASNSGSEGSTDSEEMMHMMDDQFGREGHFHVKTEVVPFIIKPGEPEAIDLDNMETLRLAHIAIDVPPGKKGVSRLFVKVEDPDFDDEEDGADEVDGSEEEDEHADEKQAKKASKPEQKGAKKQDAKSKGDAAEKEGDEDDYILLATLRADGVEFSSMMVEFSGPQRLLLKAEGAFDVHVILNHIAQVPHGFDEDEEDMMAEESSESEGSEEGEEMSAEELRKLESLINSKLSERKAKHEQMISRLEGNKASKKQTAAAAESTSSEEDEEKTAAQPPAKKAKNEQQPSKAKEAAQPAAEAPAKKEEKAGATPAKDRKPMKRMLKGGVTALDHEEGTGRAADKGKTVLVHYTGKLTSGKVFDSSKGGQPLRVKVGAGDVIPGFDTGLQGMKEGGRRTIQIPSNQGYGTKGAKPDIPPNADLIFDLHLVKVQ